VGEADPTVMNGPVRFVTAPLASSALLDCRNVIVPVTLEKGETLVTFAMTS
jgi:hypothetical protein